MALRYLPTDAALRELTRKREPDVTGRSKHVWLLPGGLCCVQLVETLSSFTHGRQETVEGTARLRLDFYERAAGRLTERGIPHAFERRTGESSYLARWVNAPPFEVIVKNRAVGSTLRKYPGLFRPGQELARPVVKFDYRVDPEDQPIGEDYLRLLGVPVERVRGLALEVNGVLQEWLAPNSLWDFCLIAGLDEDTNPVVVSEISPDCMRLRAPDGSPLDKDLFRSRADARTILSAWQGLIDGLE